MICFIIINNHEGEWLMLYVIGIMVYEGRGFYSFRAIFEVIKVICYRGYM
jgi:hypothetical protein